MNQKDREISRDWNTWNAAFRRGYGAFKSGRMNMGKMKGKCSERGEYHGWIWARDGKALPDDPMWTVLDCDRLFQ